ncbi:MAG: sugar-binding domain-containing protein [Bacteroidales bacterium]|jgi:beta-galactosidase/beta-glucuronidase
MKIGISLLLLLSFFGAKAQKIKLVENWLIKNSLEVNIADEMVSSVQYKPEGWFPTSVPTTVLGVFVKNGTYPDPHFGMNNFMIPDVSDIFNAKHDLAKYSYLKGKENPWKDPYWFRTEVVVPKQYKNKQIWLTFNGINYRADVWVNGHLVANKRQTVGMFRRFKFNITPYAHVGVNNCIAVKIHQVDHPGEPDPGTQFVVFGSNRGHATDIFKDETLKLSGGWDCAPVVRDRNMGIYQDVFLEATGSVSIEDPYVTTILPLPDTTRADIHLQAELKNNSNKTIKGVLVARIDLMTDLVFPSYTKHLGGSMPAITVKKEVSLNANDIQTIVLDPKEFSSLSVKNPYLWWPNGYGKQYLHRLSLSFETDGTVSDKQDVTFGIRQVTTELKRIGEDYGRIFRINGKRIFCKGGWLQPDMMLDRNRKRVFDEARLLAEANVNIVGNEDDPSPTDDVMESFDKYGLMYWEVFFQCWRMYPGTQIADNPLDHQLGGAEVVDMVKRYRNNPSIIAWFTANEVMVAENLYNSTRNAVKTLDPSRPFIPSTNIDWNVDKFTPYIKDDLPTGTTDNGAPDYNWNPQPYYFDKVEEVHLQMFRNEMGVPAIPTYSSLLKFIPSVDSTQPQNLKNPIYPLDSIWAEHGAWDGFNYCFRAYDNAIRTLYGNPKTAKQYADNAQYVNADSYRAMFEAANHRMWNITSGVMLWKLNSCWPDVGWQMYDWFLNPNAAYYFAKKAMEPIHIQMNANSRKISVINATHKVLQNLFVEAEIVDFKMNVIWKYSDTISLNSDGFKECGIVPKPMNNTPIYFVKLRLKNANGQLISDNLYWQCPQHEDFSVLTYLPKAKLTKEITISDLGNELRVIVNLKNESNTLSFFNRIKLCSEKTGSEILPTFWSDNFVTLFPGEEKTITAKVGKSDSAGANPVIEIE